ncbi:MAG: LEPR-XLL domain-containing protein, partial [Planctomycetales bacterium]|nr:LEPR-XLL domain-containing protein [Planctomycetales bacterium]
MLRRFLNRRRQTTNRHRRRSAFRTELIDSLWIEPLEPRLLLAADELIEGSS